MHNTLPLFMQDNLDEVVMLWNTHRIRPYRNRLNPSGRPTLIYNLPHLHGAQNHLCRVTNDEIRLCRDECTPRSCYPCDKTVFDLSCLLMEESGLDKSSYPEEAIELYKFLRNAIHMNV